MSNRYNHLAQQVATADTPATDPPPLQTELSAACHLIEVAHTLVIDGMSELEHSLDVLIRQPSATAVSVISSIRREGQLELLRIDRRLRPSIYWFVRHVAHDEGPDNTRFVLLREFADYPSYKIVDGEMVVEVAHPPEPDLEPDLIACVICRELEATYTWTPQAPEEGQEPAPLPVCGLCAALVKSGEMLQFQAGSVSYALTESGLWAAERVTG